jgi:hypothetical protein
LPVAIHAPVAPLSVALNRISAPSGVNVNALGSPGGRLGALGTTTHEPAILRAGEEAPNNRGTPPRTV